MSLRTRVGTMRNQVHPGPALPKNSVKKKRHEARAHTNKSEIANNEGTFLRSLLGSCLHLGFEEGFQEEATFELRLETQVDLGQKY